MDWEEEMLAKCRAYDQRVLEAHRALSIGCKVYRKERPEAIGTVVSFESHSKRGDRNIRVRWQKRSSYVHPLDLIRVE